MNLPTFEKQPAENLDYTVDLSAWMPAGDTPQSAVCVADAGLVVGVRTINPGALSVVQWLSGGVDGVTYHVQLLITTTLGRVKDVDFQIKVKER